MKPRNEKDTTAGVFRYSRRCLRRSNSATAMASATRPTRISHMIMRVALVLGAAIVTLLSTPVTRMWLRFAVVAWSILLSSPKRRGAPRHWNQFSLCDLGKTTRTGSPRCFRHSWSSWFSLVLRRLLLSSSPWLRVGYDGGHKDRPQDRCLRIPENARTNELLCSDFNIELSTTSMFMRGDNHAALHPS